jgi:acyl-CoA dehydrogenase
LRAAEGSWNEALWRDLDDAGLTRALEPGGEELDIPIPEALQVVRLAGRFCTPAPLVESMLAHWLLRSAGLAGIAGPLSVAPVNKEDCLLLERVAGGWRLKGSATRVPWGRYAAALIVVAESVGQSYLAILPASSFEQLTRGENLAREPRDGVSFDAVLGTDAVVPFPPGLDHVYRLGAALRVLQMTGALDAALHLTVQYAQERKQFGRPIGKFQAIQQNIAVMAANVAASRAAANLAVSIIAGEAPSFGLAAAKLRTNEAAAIAARMAHQVHGAMGFTQEYALHFLTKRLWSWRDEFGSETVWGRVLGNAVRERGPARLWPFMTSEMG